MGTLCGSYATRVVLVAGLLGLAGRAWAADAEQPGARRRPVSGSVVDLAGKPLRGVMVFAADASTDAVVAMAASDAEGNVELVVPGRRHNFGVLSPTLGVTRLVPRGPARFELVVAALPPDPTAGAAGEPAARIDAPHAFVLRGRVVDETGAGLEGVRLEAARPTGAVVATVFSGPDGNFGLAVPGGQSRLRASAPGFNAVRSAHQGGRLVVVMAIVADPQRVTITTGRVLSFRPSDSIDPEYTPPAPVKALLRFAYGICPSATPLKAQEKSALKKYWYLDVLRRPPPNPATISTTACTAPAAYQPTSVPRTTIADFEIWADAVPAGPYLEAGNGKRQALPADQR
jgi:hypothetical protein